MRIDWEAFDKLDIKTQFKKFQYLLENNDREWALKNSAELNKRFRFANKFILVDLLPEGFYKRGFVAIDVLTHETVALLLLKPEVSEKKPFPKDISFSAMYFRESAISYKLKHPNIVEHYESGVFESQAYIAFKYEESTTLENIILHSTTLRKTNPISFLMPIGRALEYIHKKGFIHGDVKPSNTIITKEGITRLADFGTTREIKEATMILGSLSYTAPEVLEGESPTPAADVWSLGVLGYYLTYRKLPFKVEPEDWPDKLIEQIKTVEPEIDRKNRYLKVFLEKNPKKRFQDGGECRRILEWKQRYPLISRAFDFLHLPYKSLEKFIYWNNYDYLGDINEKKGS